MPSECCNDCNFDCTYKIKDIEVSRQEYEKIKRILGDLESEKKANLAKRIKDTEASLLNADTNREQLKEQLDELKLEYNNKYHR